MQRKHMLLSVVGLILLVTNPLLAGSKTEFAGHMEDPFYESFGESWESDGNFHIRGDTVSWDHIADDPRLQGVAVNTFDGDFFLNNQTFGGTFRGTVEIYVNPECERTKPGLDSCDGPIWEGSFNGKVVDGLQYGEGVLHGRGGAIDKLKAKLTFWEVQFPFPPWFEIQFTGELLEH